jgi:cyclopropane-fatty-acyl-phospholipid synthase
MTESVHSRRSSVLRALFHGYNGPPFSIRLWDGWRWHAPLAGDPVCTLVFRSTDALRSLINCLSEIRLGEAFLSKDIEVDGDIVSAFAVAEHLFQCPRGQRQRILEVISGILFGIGRLSKTGKRHSLERDLSAISYHYDQPIDFYRPWLGESLAYSCAYFQSKSEGIDTAQTNKLEMICRKLRLKPCDRFLDIGCGWGSLVLHAASRHRAYAEGITLSQEQATVAEARIAAARLTQSCKVALLDYRKSLHRLATFDKIASVGMFEHVGLTHLPQYFRTAHKLLRPGGVFLNHGIARSHQPRSRNQSLLDRSIVPFLRNVLRLHAPRSSSFIDKHVFPDGELVTLSHALHAAESAGFEIRDVENLREHYELTLRHWIEGFRRNADTLLKHVSETTYRIWLLYLAGSAAAFRRGDIGVYQVLLSRPKQGNSQLPLTREDWYSSSLSGQEVEI